MNTNTEFKIGDVVMLKSGGPEMTVQKLLPVWILRKRAAVQTIWFGIEENGIKYRTEDVFFADTIRLSRRRE